MKLNRSGNAIRNVKYGMVNRIISIVLPFIVRTVFIRELGAEYLGLNSLFSSILTVLNMTELGFSSAIVFCMYEPIANDESDTIDALLLFYKRVYQVIGLIILLVGLLLVPFLPKLINGTYPEGVNLVAVYLVYLCNTVLSYFMYAYLSALISAFQRDDLISKVNILINIAMYTAQVLILITVKNYYVYLAVMPTFTVVNNIRTAYIARRVFPQYKPKGKLNSIYKVRIKEKVSGLLINKVCVVSRNAFDSIFISAFLGLTETAIYNNYYYIMNSIVAISSVLISSVVAGAGNSVVMESQEKNYNDMNKMNFGYMWLSGWFTICLMCLYQPFMYLWVGETLMFPMHCVILICLYFYILKMGDVRSIYDQAKGLWWENRYRAILEAALNLALNYILGKYFGVVGIIAATIISLFAVNFCMGSNIIFKYYFTDFKVSEYFTSHFKYAIVTLFNCAVTYAITNRIPYGYGTFILVAILCCIIPNAIYFIVYRKTRYFGQVQNMVKNKIFRR